MFRNAVFGFSNHISVSEKYVSKKNCSDEGDGSKDNPFCTITKAIEMAIDGMTVCLHFCLRIHAIQMM